MCGAKTPSAASNGPNHASLGPVGIELSPGEYLGLEAGLESWRCCHLVLFASVYALARLLTPRLGCKPAPWTRVDRHYEIIRINMQTFFNHLGIATCSDAGQTTSCRSGFPQGPSVELSGLDPGEPLAVRSAQIR